MPSTILVISAVALLNLLFTFNYVNGRDLYTQTTISSDPLIECQKSEELDTLCMRCAKKTKGREVYEMCCNNEHSIVEFCERYIHFGSLAQPYSAR
ncbi:hypothetical protein O3M35_005372 [Rhynocoris fuscipes]|uniref:Uncharacterized protein n=1 Tax=Rhynocoris fuscipes TaxID=488301 RepID=A0AAW1DIF9_9HEMI